MTNPIGSTNRVFVWKGTDGTWFMRHEGDERMQAFTSFQWFSDARQYAEDMEYELVEEK